MANTSYDDLFDGHDTLKNVTRLKYRYYNAGIINRNRDTEVIRLQVAVLQATVNHAPPIHTLLYYTKIALTL